MWAAIIRGGCAAIVALILGGAGSGGNAAPITVAPVLPDRPLFLRNTLRAEVPGPRLDDVDQSLRTAPIPSAAFSGVILVGGIIVAGLARRRSK